MAPSPSAAVPPSDLPTPSPTPAAALPTPPSSTELSVSAADRDAFVANIIDPEQQLEPGETHFYAADAVSERFPLDYSALLEQQGWQPVNGWGRQDALLFGNWKSGSDGLVVLYFEALDEVAIESLERSYHIEGIQPGQSMLVTHRFPLPQ